MTIKTRKNIYHCAVDGFVGHGVTSKGKKVSAVCGLVRMDGTCGAHGNFKCKHKKKGLEK